MGAFLFILAFVLYLSIFMRLMNYISARKNTKEVIEERPSIPSTIHLGTQDSIEVIFASGRSVRINGDETVQRLGL